MRGMNEMMRQAQLMQKKIAQVQEEMAERTVEASVGGGMVTVECTGNQEIRKVTIDPQAVDPRDVGMLEDLVLAAVNEAIKQSKDMMEQEMGAITGGMKIPGLF